MTFEQGAKANLLDELAEMIASSATWPKRRTTRT